MLLPHWLADWFTRIGLMFGVLSFPLVTPEVIEAIWPGYLAGLNARLQQGLHWVPSGCFVVTFWVIYLPTTGSSVFWLFLRGPRSGWRDRSVGVGLIVLVFLVVVGPVVAGHLAVWARNAVERRLVTPLVRWLTDEQRRRKVLLGMGVGLFFVGNVLQVLGDIPSTREEGGAQRNTPVQRCICSGRVRRSLASWQSEESLMLPTHEIDTLTMTVTDAIDPGDWRHLPRGGP